MRQGAAPRSSLPIVRLAGGRGDGYKIGIRGFGVAEFLYQ